MLNACRALNIHCLSFLQDKILLFFIQVELSIYRNQEVLTLMVTVVE